MNRDETKLEAGVRDAERLRCAALLNHDLDRIRNLLLPEYQHTHANGHKEDFDSYMKFLQGPVRYKSVERSDLKVRLYGPVAVMNGVLSVVVIPGEGAAPVSLSFRVLQVWCEVDAKWRLGAYQATISA